MEGLKFLSWIFSLAGIVSLIIAFLWTSADPNNWGVLLPFFLGLLFLPIGLLGLIIFYVVKFIKRGKT
jgi:membrane-bound ClpP family serine protease